MHRNVFTLIAALAFLSASFVAHEARGATAPERAKRVEQMMRNDAAQLAASARQYFLEHREATTVSFGIDGSGVVTGPLHEWTSRLAKGIRVVDGKINGPKGTFTLQHEEAYDGKPVVFDCDGNIVKRPAK